MLVNVVFANFTTDNVIQGPRKPEIIYICYSLGSSVGRAPACCAGGPGFNPRPDPVFFLFPATVVSQLVANVVWLYHV